MKRNQFYYFLKPYVPWKLRMALRRALASKRRHAHQDVWPINEAASRQPEGWTGWPEGRKFALVLTHDVEGPQGLARCRDLMQLEMKLGVRSSFNFIPESDYRVSPELRRELAQNGFEVGVHDLRHDGKLYQSRKEFAARAKEINHYLKEWGASGFRSGFMLHNLDWVHDLDVQYDMSTFDTDPFEPQPDGVNTIFPFWMTGPEGRPGYVEMPYTLPQDSTLFLLLRETDTKIWKQKVDWIVERGGMVLMDTHPDYMAFGDKKPTDMEYPVRFYEEILNYIQHKYAGQFWSALPREMAQFCRARRFPRKMTSQKRVCMLSYSFYEKDNRVMRYSEALVKRGDRVDVIALKSSEEMPRQEVLNGVNVFRVQSRQQNEKGKGTYLVRLLRFLFTSSCFLTGKHLREKYDLVHVHNIPDFLVFAAWLPKLIGAKIILDIHDVVPEFFCSKFQSGGEGGYYKLLLKEEKYSMAFAHHVIISNHLWLNKIVKRSLPAEKCSVFINYTDPSVFYPRKRTRQDGKFIMIFPGGLQWHQGLDIAIRAFDIVRKEVPNAEFHIYGEGSAKPDLLALIKELQLENRVKVFGSIPIRRVPEIIADADLGVVPKRADSFGNEAYSTKIMEFMSQGIPVVVSRTSIDSFYFNESVVRFFESGNEKELARQIMEVTKNTVLRKQLVENALNYVALNSWDVKKDEYYALVDSLLGSKNGAGRTEMFAGSERW